MSDMAKGNLYMWLHILRIRQTLDSVSKTGTWNLQKLNDFPKATQQGWTRVFQAHARFKMPHCFQLMYLEDSIIFHVTDKDEIWRGKKRKLFSSPPWVPGHTVPSTPPSLTSSKPSPLWLFFLCSRSKPSSVFFYPQEMTPCQRPLVMTIYGGTRWDTWEMLRLERVFHSSLLLFPLLPATRPQTHMGGVCSVQFFVC